MLVKGGLIKDATAMPKRIAPGIGTCPGCGIPVNLNLLLKGIEGNVVFLFQTGCGMVTTTAYPKRHSASHISTTCFKMELLL